MGVPGRKGWTEELKIAQRYSDLTVPVFKVLRKHLESKNKSDQKWAVEQIGKAFVRMIPQKLSGDSESPLVIQISKESAERYDITPSPAGDSAGQT